MGASGWTYFTAYTPDPNDALKALHSDVFEKGEYHWVFDDDPTSISDLRIRNESDGTHSIIDITGIAKGPKALDRDAAFSDGFDMDFSDFGLAKTLDDASLTAWFGSTTPDRASVLGVQDDLMSVLGRWDAVVVTVYENGEPSEYFFGGITGD